MVHECLFDPPQSVEVEPVEVEPVEMEPVEVEVQQHLRVPHGDRPS